jgi:hypothetical protein
MSRHSKPGPWENDKAIRAWNRNANQVQYNDTGGWFQHGQGSDGNETRGGSGLFGKHHKPDGEKKDAFGRAVKPAAAAPRDAFGRTVKAAKPDPFHRGKGK